MYVEKNEWEYNFIYRSNEKIENTYTITYVLPICVAVYNDSSS